MRKAHGYLPFLLIQMCYPCGSVDLTVKLCPMCKVFPHPKCPHRREICRNRNVHPRFDVMFLKNAEGMSILTPTQQPRVHAPTIQSTLSTAAAGARCVLNSLHSPPDLIRPQVG